MAMEPIVKAVLAGDASTRAGLAHVAAATITSATYAAYSFYQDRKGEPLTEDEMEEVRDGVLHEYTELATKLVTHLGEISTDPIESLS